jgi:hypothetical protein
MLATFLAVFDASLGPGLACSQGRRSPSKRARRLVCQTSPDDSVKAEYLGGQVGQGGVVVPEPDMEELDEDECRRLLAEHHLGRLAVPDFGGPVIFPVNYVLDQGLVIFRTDPGSKLDAASEREQVAFEVDAVDEATRTGWSVVVRGTLAEVTDPYDLSRLRTLPLYPWAPGKKTRYVRVRPRKITGRRIAIPAELPFTWWG